jgi:signal transduction histidine kinase
VSASSQHLSSSHPDLETGGRARSAEGLGVERLWALIHAGQGLVAELDVDRVLAGLLDVACDATGARYAAVGVLDAERVALDRFVTRGIDDDARWAIGDLPRGRGILGVLIEDPTPLRLHRIGEHPRSYGLPPGHPPMATFLGVPIMVRGQVFGNLYLTDKADGGDFDAADEQAAVVLAAWAAIAVENSRLYGEASSRHAALERANRRLEATTTIARAVGAETDLDLLLDLIVKRARALVDARTMVIWVQVGDELQVAAIAGESPRHGKGVRIPVAGSLSGEIARSERAERLNDAGASLRLSLDRLGLEAGTALLAPLSFRGQVSGVIAAYDHLGPDRRFSLADEELLTAFAASAATAVANSQSVTAERLRQSLRAAEQERQRWARELHDETLQGLAGLAIGLRSARRSGDQAVLEGTVDDVVAQIADEIHNLRCLITDLRPAALDQLGVHAAIEGLIDRLDHHGPAIHASIHLDGPVGQPHTRYEPELEATLYRLVQEALNNAVHHADATTIGLDINQTDHTITTLLTDDGKGFDPAQHTDGFGLRGMRERVELAGGTLHIDSRPRHGTTLRATLPTT